MKSELFCPMRHAGDAGRRRFSVSGNRARIIVVAACVLTLLSASTVLVGRAMEEDHWTTALEGGAENDEQLPGFPSGPPRVTELKYVPRSTTTRVVTQERVEPDERKPPTAAQYKEFKGERAIVGPCGMLKYDQRDLTEVLKVLDWYSILGNLEVAQTARSPPRHREFLGLKLRFLPRVKKRLCTKPEQLIEGLKAAAQGAPGLTDPTIQNAFNWAIEAVVKYRTAGTLRRLWMCRKVPVEYEQEYCDQGSEYFIELLRPLKKFMCAKDFWNACGRWSVREIDEIAV